MDRVWTYLQAVMTVVMAVATILMGITVPSLWSMSKDIGKLEARGDTVEKRFDAIDKGLGTLDGKLDAVGKRVDGIDVRLAQRDTDPTALVAQAGLRPESEFAGVRIGQKLFVLPKNDKAHAELTTLGLQREAITPTTFGYVLGTYDTAGRLGLQMFPSASPSVIPVPEIPPTQR